MRFGIFDHLDDGGVPLSQLFEERLQLIEAYDRAADRHAELGHSAAPSSTVGRNAIGG